MWTVEWSARSERDLLNLPHWREAERIAVAVYRYAQTGEGNVRHVVGAGDFLHAGRCRARLFFDVTSRTIHVWYVYAVK